MDDDRSPPVSFYPDVGRHWFCFRGWPFILEYDADEGPKTREMGVAIAHKITIRCAGWDPQPAKDYLFACKSFVQDKTKDKTTVYQTGGGGHMPWIGPQVLPSRPLETVELDGKIKEELVDETAHYLKPEVQKYYEENGIPYRSGYLFYGPPGTGKSSLCRALAGHFALELYMLDLTSVESAHSLRDLFGTLPPKCIVVLEDVDTAGLRRESAESDKVPWTKSLCHGDLLNVLDGSAAQEGRIVIMTANNKEDLDSALVRTGRVDKQVLFSEMSREAGRRVFQRMFRRSGLEEEELEKCAQEFLAKLPKGKVTPAELQGFLLNCKESPSKAVVDADAWITKHFAPDTVSASEKTSEKVDDAVERTENSGHNRKSKEVSDLSNSRAPGLVLSFAPEVITIVNGDEDSGSETSSGASVETITEG